MYAFLENDFLNDYITTCYACGRTPVCTVLCIEYLNDFKSLAIADNIEVKIWKCCGQHLPTTNQSLVQSKIIKNAIRDKELKIILFEHLTIKCYLDKGQLIKELNNKKNDE